MSSRDNSPDGSKGVTNEYCMDGIYLSESGIQHMKYLSSGIEISHQRKKRKDLKKAQMEKEAAIMAAIESVVCNSRGKIILMFVLYFIKKNHFIDLDFFYKHSNL